jgi:hypothetical protein
VIPSLIAETENKDFTRSKKQHSFQQDQNHKANRWNQMKSVSVFMLA